MEGKDYKNLKKESDDYLAYAMAIIDQCQQDYESSAKEIAKANEMQQIVSDFMEKAKKYGG